MKRTGILTIILILAALGLAGGMMGFPWFGNEEHVTMPTATADEALTRDATAYSKVFGVSVEEAKNRIQLQGEIGALDAALESSESATFGGLWIDNGPTHKVIAAFTSDGDATIAPLR